MGKKIKVLKDHPDFGPDFLDIFDVIGQFNPIDTYVAALMLFQSVDATDQS